MRVGVSVTTALLLSGCNTPFFEVQPEILCVSKCAGLQTCFDGVGCGDDCGSVFFTKTFNDRDSCVSDCVVEFDHNPDIIDHHRSLHAGCRSLTSCAWINCVGVEGDPIDCNQAGIRDADSAVWSPVNIDYCGSF
tara:strand:+ start:106 stop:510 length:405 start_codon:yes stop_codon:yes gene_type:complete